MRVIEPAKFNYERRSRQRGSRHVTIKLFIIVVIVAMAAEIWQYLMPLPTVNPTTLPLALTGKKITLTWPAYGQSAIGAVGYDAAAKNGQQKPVPIASVAKIMVALSVLKRYPLSVGQQGPIISLTQKDEQILHNYVAVDGSVVKIKAGEKISEYDALVAMLLPSANNIADTLANWAFGSVKEYTDFANKYSADLGLSQTHFADASGFSPKTVSTAGDLVMLGAKVLNNPVIAKIVNKKTATISVIGIVNNTNILLNDNGVIGIKTGNTSEAGGCYLYATNRIIDGHSVTLLGAVLGAKNVKQAMLDSFSLINSTVRGFGSHKAVSMGQKVGYYSLPWGGQVAALAQSDIEVFDWLGSNANVEVKLGPVQSTSPAGTMAGLVTVDGISANVITAHPAHGPNWRWRATRWF